MNVDDTRRLLDILKTSYPSTPIQNKKMMIELWAGYLKNYNAEVVFSAAKSYIRTHKFFPTIAEFTALVDKINVGSIRPTLDTHRIIEPSFSESGCFWCPCMEPGQKDFCRPCKFEGKFSEVLGSIGKFSKI